MSKKEKTPENENIKSPNKRYIEVTQEDYELALAAKVVQKSYKMIGGVILLILALLTFLGIKYNVDINEAKTELSKVKVKFEDESKKYDRIANDLQERIKAFENERSFTEKYYQELSSSYSKSTQTIFSGFLVTTNENLEYLADIEKKVGLEIKAARDSVDSIKSEIRIARRQLSNNEENLKTFKEYHDRTELQKEALSTLVSELQNLSFAEIKPISLGETVYSNLLNANISYKDRGGVFSGKKDREIVIGEKWNYKLDNIPDIYEVNNTKYSIKLIGDYNDKKVVLTIKQI